MDAFEPLGADFEPVMHWPLLPDGVIKTHGCRYGLRPVSKRGRPVKSIPFIRYREKPCLRSTGA
jgi:hypothetical protein